MALIALYNSVYMESLEERNAKLEKSEAFSEDMVDTFFTESVPKLRSIPINTLIEGLQENGASYIKDNGNKLGISDDYYFMVESTGTIEEFKDENFLLRLDDNGATIHIATDFIFGNAIREASGLFSIGDYQNTMDFNNISILLNDHVRDSLLPDFIRLAKKGGHIYVKGAVKINIKNIDVNQLRVIPVVLDIQ